MKTNTFPLYALAKGKDAVFWMTKDRISEEWHIALPCEHEVFRSFISSFFDYSQRNVAIKLLCIIKNMKFLLPAPIMFTGVWC